MSSLALTMKVNCQALEETFFFPTFDQKIELTLFSLVKRLSVRNWENKMLRDENGWKNLQFKILKGSFAQTKHVLYL